MTDQEKLRVAVIVTMPADIDLTNQDRAYDQLYAAFSSGASLVIADFTGTSFCDCSSMRRLLAVQARAAARDAQLRVAITPDGAVSRIVELMQIDCRLVIYPTAQAAIPPPGQDPQDTPAGSPGPAPRSHHAGPSSHCPPGRPGGQYGMDRYRGRGADVPGGVPGRFRLAGRWRRSECTWYALA